MSLLTLDKVQFGINESAPLEFKRGFRFIRKNQKTRKDEKR